MNTTTTIPTDPQEFEKFLVHYDWFYAFSDDHRVYMRGIEAERQLNEFMKTASDEHKRIYNRQHRLRYDNASFVTPERPYVYPFSEVETPKLLARGSATPDHQTAQYFYMALQRADLMDRISAHDLRAWVERAEVYDTPGGRLIFETFQLSHPFVAHDINAKN